MKSKKLAKAHHGSSKPRKYEETPPNIQGKIRSKIAKGFSPKNLNNHNGSRHH